MWRHWKPLNFQKTVKLFLKRDPKIFRNISRSKKGPSITYVYSATHLKTTYLNVNGYKETFSTKNYVVYQNVNQNWNYCESAIILILFKNLATISGDFSANQRRDGQIWIAYYGDLIWTLVYILIFLIYILFGLLIGELSMYLL